MSAKVVVFSGPAGSGKNSVLREVLKRAEGRAVRLTTATTREPRDGEVPGVDHYFMTKKEFLDAVDAGMIPEYWHAKRTDRYYGTYAPDLEEKLATGKTILAEVQIEGMRYFADHFDTLTLFIAPESIDDLCDRITRRGPMSDAELNERLEEARLQMHDDAPLYDYVVVNKNNKLAETVTEVMDILKKEQYL